MGLTGGVQTQRGESGEAISRGIDAVALGNGLPGRRQRDEVGNCATAREQALKVRRQSQQIC